MVINYEVDALATMGVNPIRFLVMPGLDAPTVTKLHGREWYSVKAMVPQEEANSIMDKLWDAGARSILLFGIKSARI